MTLNIKIETYKMVCNDILDRILDLADSCQAESLEIEGLDTCEPFFTEEEIADIIKKHTGKKFYEINKISLK